MIPPSCSYGVPFNNTSDTVLHLNCFKEDTYTKIVLVIMQMCAYHQMNNAVAHANINKIVICVE